MSLLLFSGCGLWPLEEDLDQSRCHPVCQEGHICYRGECLDLGPFSAVAVSTFTMGSPTTETCRELMPSKETQHQVDFTHSFKVSQTEVTQGAFQALMGYNNAQNQACGPTCPIEMVTWHEAAAYCNARSRLEGLALCYACTGSGTQVQCENASTFLSGAIYTCMGYRLPTEAEWEFAARANTSTALHNGDLTNCTGEDSHASQVGWYKANSGLKSNPVGKKTPNKWNLYDLHGNMWEWCHDWWQQDLGSAAVTNPWGAATGDKRILRGGSWNDEPSSIRSALRHSQPPTAKFSATGFRIVRSLN